MHVLAREISLSQEDACINEVSEWPHLEVWNQLGNSDEMETPAVCLHQQDAKIVV